MWFKITIMRSVFLYIIDVLQPDHPLKYTLQMKKMKLSLLSAGDVLDLSGRCHVMYV